MQFANPLLLSLLAVIPVILIYVFKKNSPASFLYSLPIPSSIRSIDPIKAGAILKSVALGAMIIALARPQGVFKYTERTVNGVDIVMVMDVSASMNIEDLADTSRLEVAKRTMIQFIQGREVDRIGFVIFSGEAVTLAPPTLDYALLKQGIDSIETGVLKDGTAIGDGLAVAVSRLKNSKAKSRVIVLLTDGDSNVGKVDPVTAGELAADQEIKVYSIAIGKEGRVKLPIRQKIGGQTITSYQWFDNALNTQLLEDISRKTGAKFYRASDEKTLESVFKDINQLEKSKFEAHEHMETEEWFQWPLKLGLLILFVERILAFTWWRVFP